MWQIYPTLFLKQVGPMETRLFCWKVILLILLHFSLNIFGTLRVP